MVDNNHAVRLSLDYGVKISSKPWTLVVVITFEITSSSIGIIMLEEAAGCRAQNNVALSS